MGRPHNCNLNRPNQNNKIRNSNNPTRTKTTLMCRTTTNKNNNTNNRKLTMSNRNSIRSRPITRSSRRLRRAKTNYYPSNRDHSIRKRTLMLKLESKNLTAKSKSKFLSYSCLTMPPLRYSSSWL